jgi:transposase
VLLPPALSSSSTRGEMRPLMDRLAPVSLAESTRREYRRRLDHNLDAIMALAPASRHGQRLRRRYGKVRDHLFTFLDHPEVAADNNSSERELRPTATYRKVTGGFRSN